MMSTPNLRSREVEIKYRVADVEELLAALQANGVTLGPATRQHDQAYAPATWKQGQDRRGVPFARLRTENGSRNLFAVKVLIGAELDCQEHEVVLDDRAQMHAALLAMAYRPTVQVHKTRRSGWWGPVNVCVDAVDGLGTFLELEQKLDTWNAMDVQAELADRAATLGVRLKRVEATYDALLHEAQR